MVDARALNAISFDDEDLGGIEPLPFEGAGIAEDEPGERSFRDTSAGFSDDAEVQGVNLAFLPDAPEPVSAPTPPPGPAWNNAPSSYSRFGAGAEASSPGNPVALARAMPEPNSSPVAPIPAYGLDVARTDGKNLTTRDMKAAGLGAAIAIGLMKLFSWMGGQANRY